MGPALIAVDLQRRIVDLATEPRSAHDVVAATGELACAFRARGAPVVLVRTVNLERPDPDGDRLVPELAGDVEIVKHQWGAFHGTSLDVHLRRLEVDTVVLCGLMTNFGVESTARAADELGYSVVLVEDATASVTSRAHAFSVDEIFGRLGRVTTAARAPGLLWP